MNRLVQLPTRDPLMRAYRLPTTRSGRPVTIHEIIRRQAAAGAHRGAEQTRHSSIASAARPTYPWWATR
jgi:hypothetical protein